MQSPDAITQWMHSEQIYKPTSLEFEVRSELYPPCSAYSVRKPETTLYARVTASVGIPYSPVWMIERIQELALEDKSNVFVDRDGFA